MGVYPSDYYHQWGWDDVSADIIWRNTAVSLLVTVIDTGVDYTNPDLSGGVVKGRNFVDDSADQTDDYGREGPVLDDVWGPLQALQPRLPARLRHLLPVQLRD